MHCKVMRNIASKLGNWLFYDEQFGYNRQSAPVCFPWNTINWKLWLRAVTNFRARPTKPSDKVTPHCPSHQTFPTGTCWAFQGGQLCDGCPFAHGCLKFDSPQSASQCNQSAWFSLTWLWPGLQMVFLAFNAMFKTKITWRLLSMKFLCYYVLPLHSSAACTWKGNIFILPERSLCFSLLLS